MTVDALPISETFTPSGQDEIVAVVADCRDSGRAIYPIGGATSLDCGRPAKTPGIGLSLAGMSRIVDFPARDLTITVESGVTMAALAEELSKENLLLPIDVPHAETATLGGVIATNFNGPRRYGQGTVRDYVIGIHAVDGRGRAFKGGGRVVKNVAGYDFCKLLTGSFGTLGIINEVTLRLKPAPRRSAFLVAAVDNAQETQTLLAALVESNTTPTAIELLAGPAWADDAWVGPLVGAANSSANAAAIAVGLEGTPGEVDWMIDALGREWQAQGVGNYTAILDDDAQRLWKTLAEFPQRDASPLVIKATMTPSHVAPFVAAARVIDPDCSIQAHAGNGIVVVRFAEFPAEGLSRTLVQNLVPVASKGHGNVVVLANPSGAEMTHQSVWGGIDAPFQLMSEIKRQFDPNNILNPERFVYV